MVLIHTFDELSTAYAAQATKTHIPTPIPTPTSSATNGKDLILLRILPVVPDITQACAIFHDVFDFEYQL